MHQMVTANLQDYFRGNVRSMLLRSSAVLSLKPNIQPQMFGKLGEAKQKAEEIKKKLQGIQVDGQAGNGKVKVTATADRAISDIFIADELISPDRKEELQDLIVMAVEDAMAKAENVSQSEMSALMNSMLPGGLGNLLK
jgi:DNA-binding YbaB/EbfC family protein